MLAGVNAPTVEPAPGRARPLPPAERRAALIAATLPLVSQHGTKVTTRQIAEAAGVAEGTIFRVFPDKEALINAAVEAALDPLPVLAELGGIDQGLPLRERLAELTRIIQRRLRAVTNLLIALGRQHGPDHGKPPHRRPHGVRHEAVQKAIIGILEPERDRFRYPVPEVARMLWLLTFSGTHPLLTEGNPLTAEDISSILLDGVLRRP